ncbi:MAG: hypothetical protein H6839_13325 [Planctomycetes bacterium]|nr:hypothetical protein [Planctomycetota bacterium]
MTADDTVEFLTDDEAKAALQEAAEIVQDVLGMVHTAIKRVRGETADEVHAARVEGQAKRIRIHGIRADDGSILGMHPLYALWRLALKAASQLERLLSITSPKLFAGRQVALNAAKELAKASKLKDKVAAA